MHDRSVLGPADVDDARLAALAAAALGVADEVELLSSRAEVVAYDIEALTTAGRYRVIGRARHREIDAGFAFFVNARPARRRHLAAPGGGRRVRRGPAP